MTLSKILTPEQMKPVRVQRKRTKGWKMPPNTVSVTRPGPWGNPFKIGEITHVWHRSAAWPYEMYLDAFPVMGAEHSIRLFEKAMEQKHDWKHETWKPGDISELRGKNLACFCPLDRPCHADVLLELANGDLLEGE